MTDQVVNFAKITEDVPSPWMDVYKATVRINELERAVSTMWMRKYDEAAQRVYTQIIQQRVASPEPATTHLDAELGQVSVEDYERRYDTILVEGTHVRVNAANVYDRLTQDLNLEYGREVAELDYLPAEHGFRAVLHLTL